MRKILKQSRVAIAKFARFFKQTSFAMAVTGGCTAVGLLQSAVAQTYNPTGQYAMQPSGFAQQAGYVAPTALSQSGASSVLRLGDVPALSKNNSVVDSAFRGDENGASVTQASYLGNMGLRALHDAECRGVGYGPNATCNARWYFGFDALWFRREGLRRYSLTRNDFLDNGVYEFGGRYTIGKMCDCVNAYEFVYAGPFRWDRRSETVGAANVDSKFVTGGALADAFNGADRHIQHYRSALDNYEVNRRWWAWDAVSTMIGVRYVNFRDRYTLQSFRSAAPTTGTYEDNCSNDLVGAQIGGNIFLPTSLKTSVNFKGKAGLFANFASRTVDLRENGASILKNGFDDTDVAGLIELGVNGVYQITPSIALSGGYEFWYLPGISTVSNQRNHNLSLSSGSSIRMNDDILLHGFNASVQVLY